MLLFYCLAGWLACVMARKAHPKHELNIICAFRCADNINKNTLARAFVLVQSITCTISSSSTQVSIFACVLLCFLTESAHRDQTNHFKHIFPSAFVDLLQSTNALSLTLLITTLIALNTPFTLKLSPIV